jgi:uncharacterized protein (TIGR02996 family)
MHDEAAFLRMTAAAPDDDAPRLIFADWLEECGDPRGSFIRVQCALATLPADDPRRPDLEQAERHLLAAHAAGWTHDLAGRVSGWQLRRGFVEEVRLSAAAFLEHGPDLLRTGTVRTVRLYDCGDDLAALARAPALGCVTGLDLCGNHLGDAGLAALLRSEHLRGLRALDLSFNSLSNAGVQALLAAGPWPGLRALDLRGNERITGRGATLLARTQTLPALESLDLRDNQIDGPGVWVLAHSTALPRLADLGLAGNPIGDAGARSLAESKLLPRLIARSPALDLRQTDLGPSGVQALAAAGRLKPVTVLRLDGNRVGDAGLTVLTASDLRQLRELHLARNGISDEGAHALAGEPLLSRLTLLDLSDNGLSKAGAVALLSSPYRHWRTVFELSGNRPSEPDFDSDAPIPFDYEDE